MSNVTNQKDSIENAKKLLSQTGIRVTDKRLKMLSILLRTETPLSAYEIMHRFNNEYDEQVIANSIYRILNCLIKLNLVHRLASINKYVACNNPVCTVEQHIPIFVICRLCQKTHESPASEMLIKKLNRIIESNEFAGDLSEIELKGLCHQCSNKVNRLAIDHDG